MAGESPRREFYVATPEEIRSGQTSDIYFFRTLDVLKKAGKDRVRVLMETTAQALPNGWPWAVCGGLEETVNLLRGRKVDLWALPEGTVFPPMTPRGIPVPVLYIEGPYGEFCIYETPVLGFLCEASGIATKSARVRVAAGERRVISFGVRRMHPALAPLIERCVYLGGLDSVTTPLGAAMLGKEPMGTMPHALTIVMGGPREAFRALQKHLEKRVPRMALVDTYHDEKTEAILAAEEIKDLAGVRLDTPASRRGNFASIVREVRWELDLRGHKDAKSYWSGGGARWGPGETAPPRGDRPRVRRDRGRVRPHAGEALAGGPGLRGVAPAAEPRPRPRLRERPPRRGPRGAGPSRRRARRVRQAPRHRPPSSGGGDARAGRPLSRPVPRRAV